MQQVEQHAMQLEKIHPSGAEEWRCPTCNRRFLVQWPPKYKKIILEPGDEYASHSGGKGGLLMQTPVVNQVEELPLSDVWHTAIEKLDFTNWYDADK